MPCRAQAAQNFERVLVLVDLVSDAKAMHGLRQQIEAYLVSAPAHHRSRFSFLVIFISRYGSVTVCLGH